MYFRRPYLVEDRFLWTDKAPLEDLLSAVIEVHGQADVKDLTVVFRICVITVGSRVTTEGGGDALPDGGGVAGKSQHVRGRIPLHLDMKSHIVQIHCHRLYRSTHSLQWQSQLKEVGMLSQMG